MMRRTSSGEELLRLLLITTCLSIVSSDILYSVSQADPSHAYYISAAMLPRPRQLDKAAMFLFFVFSFLSPRTLAVTAVAEPSSPDVYVATQGQLGKLCLGFEGTAPPDGTRLKCK